MTSEIFSQSIHIGKKAILTRFQKFKISDISMRNWITKILRKKFERDRTENFSFALHMWVTIWARKTRWKEKCLQIVTRIPFTMSGVNTDGYPCPLNGHTQLLLPPTLNVAFRSFEPRIREPFPNEQLLRKKKIAATERTIFHWETARVNHKVFMPWGIRYRYIRSLNRDRTNITFSILISDRRILDHI